MSMQEATRQWSSRPADERFTSLIDLRDHFQTLRANSRAVVASSRQLQAVSQGSDHKELVVTGPNGHAYAPTHYSFGQLCSLVKAPASYLRGLPSELAADCLNLGFYRRDAEDVGCLLTRNGEDVLRAATGPNYGRVWNADLVQALIDKFGDGITGDFRVPGEFGKEVVVDNRNTTIYGSDRDVFVFLADEKHRIEIPNRRNGEAGSLARGFYVWNSEVGASTLGVATFLFDYACSNRTIWGGEQYKEIRIRHTSGAPDRFIEEVEPALISYANSSSVHITEAIEKARAARLEPDKIDDFLKRRQFTTTQASAFKAIHAAEEGRPIENLWDASVAITAYARAIQHQDKRVELESRAGAILDMAA